jgi:hypothetical protein
LACKLRPTFKRKRERFIVNLQKTDNPTSLIRTMLLASVPASSDERKIVDTVITALRFLSSFAGASEAQLRKTALQLVQQIAINPQAPSAEFSAQLNTVFSPYNLLIASQRRA